MIKKWDFWPVITGLSGFIAVAMGAAGAHVVADSHMAALVEKAAFYQLIHTAALLFLIARTGRAAQLARYAFFAGMIFFSGSLYVKGFGMSSSAPLAPMGGMAMMLGWLLLCLTRKSDYGTML